MIKIYLSPSAQENNKYAVQGTNEEVQMNRVCDVVQRELRRVGGFEIYRNSPNMTLAQIVADSNAKVGKGGCHFAMHSNAGGGKGAEVFAYSPNSSSDRMAKLVYAEIEMLTPIADRGIKYSPHWDEVWKTTAMAVLSEISFHDMAEQAQWIINNVEAIGMAYARAICKFYGIAFESPIIAPPIIPQIDYKAEFERVSAECNNIKSQFNAANSQNTVLSANLNLANEKISNIREYIKQMLG